MPTSLRSVGNLQYPPHRREYEDCKQILKLSLNPTHNKTPGKTSAGQAVRRLALMGRAVSEDCQPASAALLHPVNPLPFITRSARLYKQLSGDLSLPPPRISEIPRFCQRQNLCISYRNSLLQKPQDSSCLCPSYPHRGRMNAFATAVRGGPSALRGPLDSSFASI